MKNKFYFFNRAEKHLDNGLSFYENDFDSIINILEQDNEEYEPITWEELKELLIEEGYYYCYFKDAIVNDEYAKELGLIDYDDDEDFD